MRVTYPEAEFNFIDVTALGDSRAMSASIKEFAEPALFLEDIRMRDYGTMELNQFVLDGSKAIFPSQGARDVAYWSDDISDDRGHFAVPPALDVSFAEAHSSVGITLYFSGDIPETVVITWYTVYGTRLEAVEFHPDRQVYFCSHNVQNYGKLSFSFPNTAWPERYVKMDYIEYGKLWKLSRDTIKSASVYEEIDVTSATLSINTADIEIVDAEGDFSLSEQKGLWDSLQKEQAVHLLEYVDGSPVDCGTFYLDDWNSQKSLVKFSMIDLIGVIDKTNFYEGKIYNRERAGTIIAAIMESCGVRDYFVEDTVAETLLSGWLGIQSHREALQQVTFACGAVADCSRSSRIRIYRPDQYVSHTIGLERKFMGSKISLDEYVSDVSVSYTEYQLDSESRQISKNTLPAGSSRIEFSDPYLAGSVSVGAGVIRAVSVNYVVVEMEQEGECLISGQKYETIENTCTAGLAWTEAGEVRKVREYKGCTLMDAEKARSAAERILNHYQMRQMVEMRYVNEGEAAGNWCDIALVGGGQATTGIVSQTLDLTGGNLATVKCRGYSRNTTDFYFAGQELYAGEGGII